MLAGDLWVPAWLVMVLVSGYFMTLALHAPGVARNTYAELRRRGYEVCPGCGYALRGLEPDAERCPECGREREPLPPPPIVKEPKKPDPLRGELPPGGFDQWS